MNCCPTIRKRPHKAIFTVNGVTYLMESVERSRLTVERLMHILQAWKLV